MYKNYLKSLKVQHDVNVTITETEQLMELL